MTVQGGFKNIDVTVAMETQVLDRIAVLNSTLNYAVYTIVGTWPGLYH